MFVMVIVKKKNVENAGIRNFTVKFCKFWLKNSILIMVESNLLMWKSIENVLISVSFMMNLCQALYSMLPFLTRPVLVQCGILKNTNEYKNCVEIWMKLVCLSIQTHWISGIQNLNLSWSVHVYSAFHFIHNYFVHSPAIFMI